MNNKQIIRLHHRIDFNNLVYHDNVLFFDVNFDNLIDAASVFDGIKSRSIKLDGAKNLNGF